MNVDNNQHNWRFRLSGHAGNDSVVTISLCEAFLHEVPSLLTKVNRQLQSDECCGSDLFHPIHTLKSCLNYVAEPKQVALASDLEQRAKSNDIDWVRFQSDFKDLAEIALGWVEQVKGFHAELVQASRRD